MRWNRRLDRKFIKINKLVESRQVYHTGIRSSLSVGQ